MIATTLTETAPTAGVPVPVAPGIRRLLAPNPGPMTYHGTNTWLVTGPRGTVVIDPGPDNAGHVQAILAAAPDISDILVTHHHHDHLGAAAALKAATGVGITAFHAAPHADIPVADGDEVAGLRAIHTPGHASDHLCFVRDGVLFSGDQAMSWSSTTISLPDGDMAAYVASLRLLLGGEYRLLLPGHGPPHPQPRALLDYLLDHRLRREALLVASMAERPATANELTLRLYVGVDPRLVPAAERNVRAHLAKLAAEGRAAVDGDRWRSIPAASVSA